MYPVALVWLQKNEPALSELPKTPPRAMTGFSPTFALRALTARPYLYRSAQLCMGTSVMSSSVSLPFFASSSSRNSASVLAVG